jgi:hypothetical protein
VPNLISIFRCLGRFAKNPSWSEAVWYVSQQVIVFTVVGCYPSRPTTKLEDHPVSAVRDCLFNIFAATLYIWRPFPASATGGRAMSLWQGTHLTWKRLVN